MKKSMLALAVAALLGAGVAAGQTAAFVTVQVKGDLLPEVVLRGPKAPRPGRARAADLESLTFELVQHGLAAASATEDNLHAKVVNRVERELIAQVMTSCDSVQTKAATKLGINRNTLHKKLKEYGLDGEK